MEDPMLLRVSASNFLSIAAKQELSLVATKLKGPEVSVFPVPGTDLEALPSAVMYGANASGKTNFIQALRFMRMVILSSHTLGDPEGGVPRETFALDKKYDDRESEFEADFIVDGVRFQYGFTCDNQRFVSEWLYSYPEGKRRKLFERNGSEVDFGQYFKGPKKILVDLMRINSLFISTATQNDHEELSKIVSFFRKINIVTSVSVAVESLNAALRRDHPDGRTIEFLSSIGTGIVGYREIDTKIPEELQEMLREIDAVARRFSKNMGYKSSMDTAGEKEVRIELAHVGVDGGNCYFDLQQESSGTRRLMLVMNLVFRALDAGSLVVLDELDASLHTFAAEQIVRLFSDKALNRLGAQLISTTHDTNLLNSQYLRRDQVWFCEKDKVGASYLFPLSEIKSRQTDNFERGYLEGRYGAIPCSADLSSLLRG
jgi:AAA15 family ATPase/GTPase